MLNFHFPAPIFLCCYCHTFYVIDSITHCFYFLLLNSSLSFRRFQSWEKVFYIYLCIYHFQRSSFLSTDADFYVVFSFWLKFSSCSPGLIQMNSFQLLCVLKKKSLFCLQFDRYFYWVKNSLLTDFSFSILKMLHYCSFLYCFWQEVCCHSYIRIF